jgi:hypothetical protein
MLFLFDVNFYKEKKKKKKKRFLKIKKKKKRFFQIKKIYFYLFPNGPATATC